MHAPVVPAEGHPIRGVLFDMNSTLLHGGDPVRWFTAATRLLARDPTLGGAHPDPGPAGWPIPDLDELVPWTVQMWGLAREVDPTSERDLSPQRHREVYQEMVARVGVIPTALGDALYETMVDQWEAYEEAPAVLAQLRARGIRIAILSNVGFDPRAVLERTGLAQLADALVFSYEVGLVKPHPGIFRIAAQRLGLPPEDLLMVGDSLEDDAGGAALGIRTLLLPRTAAPHHGLAQVLRLVG